MTQQLGFYQIFTFVLKTYAQVKHRNVTKSCKHKTIFFMLVINKPSFVVICVSNKNLFTTKVSQIQWKDSVKDKWLLVLNPHRKRKF